MPPRSQDPTFRQLLTLEGQTRRLSAWAQRSGVGRDVISRRLRQGYSPRAALLAPRQPRLRAVRILVVGEEDGLLAALGGSDVTLVREPGPIRPWLSAPGEPAVILLATGALGVRGALRCLEEIGDEQAVALHGPGPLPGGLAREAARRGARCWAIDAAEDVERFACFAAALHECRDATIALSVADLAIRARVQPRAARIMALATVASSTAQIRDALGVNTNTLKTHARHVLRATRASNLDDLAKRVLRGALARSREGVLEGSGGP